MILVKKNDYARWNWESYDTKSACADSL